MKLNPLNLIDFYKSGHVFQYPAGTEKVYSNFTPRSDRLAPVLRTGPATFDGKVVFFGLQGFILDVLIDAMKGARWPGDGRCRCRAAATVTTAHPAMDAPIVRRELAAKPAGESW